MRKLLSILSFIVILLASGSVQSQTSCFGDFTPCDDGQYCCDGGSDLTCCGNGNCCPHKVNCCGGGCCFPSYPKCHNNKCYPMNLTATSKPMAPSKSILGKKMSPVKK